MEKCDEYRGEIPKIMVSILLRFYLWFIYI